MKTLTLYTDFRHTPPTWNYFDVLLAAEMARIDLGCERLACRLVAGDRDGFRNDTLPPHGGDERRRWCANIVVPMSRMLASCDEDATWIERSEAEADRGPKIGLNATLHGFATNGAAAKRGLFPFRAAAMRWHKPYVTVTLRETGWHASRQSKVADWLAIAEGIARLGFDVLVIRDAMKCRESLQLVNPLYQASPVTSENSVARAEVYAGAAMNLGIANGPLWFAWFMAAPVMIFDLIHDDEPCANKGSYAWGGLKVGDRGFPNSRPDQSLYWEKAAPDRVLEAFDEILALPTPAKEAANA